MFTALIACNKNSKEDSSNTKIVWAENVQTVVPLEKDPLWTDEEWTAVYKYDKEKIFTSITNAVLAGKLKAYADYPGTPYSVKEFSNILVQFDTTTVADPNNPENITISPLKREVKSSDIVQMKFNEKIELDTVSFMLSNKVSYITFLSRKYNDVGELLGLKKLFDVKLNDGSEEKKEK